MEQRSNVELGFLAQRQLGILQSCTSFTFSLYSSDLFSATFFYVLGVHCAQLRECQGMAKIATARIAGN
jgi:hypothetical protein